MKPRGEDVASAVRRSLKEAIRSGASSRLDLGRFFVGISAATLGLFAALFALLAEEPGVDALMAASFLALFLSMLVGLRMALPPVLNITEHTELYEERHRMVFFTRRQAYIWLVLWIIGFLLGVAKLHI